MAPTSSPQAMAAWYREYMRQMGMKAAREAEEAEGRDNG